MAKKHTGVTVLAAAATLVSVAWYAQHKYGPHEHPVAEFKANSRTVTDYPVKDGLNTCIIPAGTPIQDRGPYKDTHHLYHNEPMDRASPPPGTCSNLKIGSWVLPHRIMGAIKTTGTKVSSTDPQT